MNRLVFGFLALGIVVAVGGGIEATASAQEQPMVESPPQQQTVQPDKRSYEEYRLDELKVSARRSRNALIGLSASTAVGAALLFPGLARQCFTVLVNNVEELRCSTSGALLVGFGWPLFAGGITGVLISGIMFGVRQGKIRRLKDQIEYKKRAFRWDPRTSRFVF